jgi:hypothetical protein
MQDRIGKIDPYVLKRVPRFKGLWFAIGAGFIWASIGQGSGELIWWPYLTAKYHGFFLYIVIPACVLGYFVNLEVIRYTTLTGENIFASFLRLNRLLGWVLWLGMIATFLWFGGYASAGGTALAELTHFPNGWGARGQSLFWGYCLIAFYLIPLFLAPIVYKWIEKIMMFIAITCIVGVIAACMNRDVLTVLPDFLTKVITPKLGLPDNWDSADMSKLITAITFTGMGGYYTLMYSYWIRDKGVGMSLYAGRVTSPITGQSETIPSTGYVFADNKGNKREMTKWIKAIWIDNAMGVGINSIGLILLCLLSYAILAPKQIVPGSWQIAVVQSELFRCFWGNWGRVLFLVIAAAFLSDTWLGVTDAVSRMNADFITLSFKRSRKKGFRWWYYTTVIFLTVVTGITMTLEGPGTLIVIGGVANFFAMAIYCPALIVMNYSVLPKRFPNWVRPSMFSFMGILFATICYLALAACYLLSLIFCPA